MMLYYFGECAIYHTEDPLEKEEAHQYLSSWKKFIIRKLGQECKKVEIKDEQWIFRKIGCLELYTSVALKISVSIHIDVSLESQFLGKANKI